MAAPMRTSLIQQCFSQYSDSSPLLIPIFKINGLARGVFWVPFTTIPIQLSGVKPRESAVIQAMMLTLFWTGGIAGPILVMFTNFYEILPYRYIPLIVFFAIGTGTFFSKKSIS